MPPSVFEHLENLLQKHGIAFQVLRHEPVYTSEEAARVRGTPLASGAKALVCKGEEGFVMFVIPADRKLDSRAVRRAKGWRKLRFATREEVSELTGLAPGSIPPFGSLFGLPTLCDERLGDSDVDGDGDVDICSKPWRGDLHVYLKNMLVEHGGRAGPPRPARRPSP